MPPKRNIKGRDMDTSYEFIDRSEISMDSLMKRIKILEDENYILQKGQSKYRNLVMNHKIKIDSLEYEFKLLIDENSRLTDLIKNTKHLFPK